MKSVERMLRVVMTGVVLALGARDAGATSVQDLVRVKGQEQVVLTGMGIVIGLNGTGDSSGDALVAARPFAKLLTHLGNPVDVVAELDAADAYAIVQVTLRVPPEGARDGDRFDVSVAKVFNAESLEGGRLVVSLLRLPGPDRPDAAVMAFAEGPVFVDPGNPASGRVRKGGQMLRDIRTTPVSAGGTLTLVLKPQYASFPVATTIGNAINDEFAIDGISNISTVEDAKNIRIQVPREDRRNPAQFIATLLMIPIDPSLIQTEARIIINRKAGIIVVQGDVQIGPVAVSHKGMQLSNVASALPPLPGAEPVAPSAPRQWVGVDTTGGSTASSTRLADLLAAFEQLSVPTVDQIAIIYELEKTGSLHAEIIDE